DPECAAVGAQRQQRGHAGFRVLEVMQHPAAVDVVENAEIAAGQRKKRAVDPSDVAQLADSSPFPRNFVAPGADVDMDDFRVGLTQLLGQIDRSVAGAGARNENAESAVETAPATETVLVDHRQIVQPGADDPRLLFRGFAQRIGVALVLILDGGQDLFGDTRFHFAPASPALGSAWVSSGRSAWT